MRGRPKLMMTKRRRQVLEKLMEHDGWISFAELARRCGLYDYRHARRIVKDLRKMNEI